MLTQFTSGRANKSLVVILTVASSALALYFGNAKWEPLAILLIGMAIHYYVPNLPAPAPPADPPVPPGGM